MKIDLIAGARPNFMKISPIIDSINSLNNNLTYRLIHTGQHYDKKMSGNFFDQLGIPKPDVNLGVGSGSHSYQVAEIMKSYEKEIQNYTPDICLVVGDVNSTLACSIVAKKCNIKVGHVEGGIRSFDLSMPEEINRMVTDSITDYFFTTSVYANNNLINSGFDKSNIFFVGNTMIDTLLKFRSKFLKPSFFNDLMLESNSYFVLTLHRPSNVDSKEKLEKILTFINKNVRDKSVIFPIHPRTRKIFSSINKDFHNIKVVEPMTYLEFNYLVENSFCVITDSGGITEEATVLNIPCITLRNNTERPETVHIGTNELVGDDLDKFGELLVVLFDKNWKKGQIPELWDGKASERIVEILNNLD